MKIQHIREKIKATIKKATTRKMLNSYLIGALGGTLLAVGQLAFLTIFDYIKANDAKADIQEAIQEAGAYDMFQNHETENYQISVLDNTEEKDVRYYSKRFHQYRYYRVKSDLSIEEMPVTETAFFPEQYKGE